MEIFAQAARVCVALLVILPTCMPVEAHPVSSADRDKTQQNLAEHSETWNCRACEPADHHQQQLDSSALNLEAADVSYAKRYPPALSSADLRNAALICTAFEDAAPARAYFGGADLSVASLADAYFAQARTDKTAPSPPPEKPIFLPTTSVADTPAFLREPVSYTAKKTSDGWWSGLPKSKKMLYTNLTAATAIGLWGLATWDYGSAGFTQADEGWFEQNSKYGGADKLGHLWSTYVFSDALTGLYKSWGYGSLKANTYAALSAWAVQAMMEAGDATSATQGFSYEDMIMNTIGALTSVVLERYPELDRKIDLRVEYVFNEPVNSIFDDYSNQYYSIVLKLAGFDSIDNTFAKYVEFSGGYYTRGYEETEKDNTRSVFVGIGFNFSRLLDLNGWKKTGKVLEYLQVPYTVPKASYDLD